MLGYAKVQAESRGGAQFYRGCSITSEAKRFLVNGTKIAILHREGRFFFAAIENSFGYVLSENVQMEEAENEAHQ